MAQLEKPIRILFVCHGNICRSPMAHYVMEDLVRRRGIADAFVIDSAATSSEELGNPVHGGTRRVLEQQGVPCGGHRARRIRPDEEPEWDLIVVMDQANYRNTLRRLGLSADSAGARTVHMLLEFAGEDRSVADPWYTGDFETTYDDVAAGCNGLLSWLGF